MCPRESAEGFDRSHLRLGARWPRLDGKREAIFLASRDRNCLPTLCPFETQPPKPGISLKIKGRKSDFCLPKPGSLLKNKSVTGTMRIDKQHDKTTARVPLSDPPHVPEKAGHDYISGLLTRRGAGRRRSKLADHRSKVANRESLNDSMTR